MADNINREEAIYILEKYMTKDTESLKDGIVKDVYLMAKDHAKGYLKIMESAENRRGEWKKTNNRKKSYMYDCSACGKTAYFCGMMCAYDFCPNCGADMRGKSNDR